MNVWEDRSDGSRRIITWTCPFCRQKIESSTPIGCTYYESWRASGTHMIAIGEHLSFTCTGTSV